MFGKTIMTSAEGTIELYVDAGVQGRAVNPRTPEHSGVEVPTPELFWGWILFWD